VGSCAVSAGREWQRWQDERIAFHERVLEEAMALVRAHSLARDRTDLARVEDEARAIARRSGFAAQLDGALEHLASGLSDEHSFYLSKEATESVAAPGAAIDARAIASASAPVEGVPRVAVHAFVAIDERIAARAASHLRSLVNAAAASGSCG
jgi:hypothetical protein